MQGNRTCSPSFNILTASLKVIRNSIFSCVYMDAVLSEEVHGLLDQFEADGIGCVPLKGIQTKALYPSTELRTMGDLDILYQGRQSKKLRETMEKMGYEWHGEAAKHDHYQKGPMKWRCIKTCSRRKAMRMDISRTYGNAPKS